MSVGHNAKTAAEAGLQPWMHGGSELEGGCGGGEAACARLSIRKSSIGLRRALDAPFAEVLPKDCALFPHTTLGKFRTSRGDRRSELHNAGGTSKQAGNLPIAPVVACVALPVQKHRGGAGHTGSQRHTAHRLNR